MDAERIFEDFREDEGFKSKPSVYMLYQDAHEFGVHYILAAKQEESVRRYTLIYEVNYSSDGGVDNNQVKSFFS